jgi:hypothetical protein
MTEANGLDFDTGCKVPETGMGAGDASREAEAAE